MTIKNNDIDNGMTFQMSLDHFVNDQSAFNLEINPNRVSIENILAKMNLFRNRNKKCELAKQALGIDPNCLEAYIALGKYSDDIFESLNYYQKATQMATCKLGNAYFQQDKKDFYFDDETRLFFCAKSEYADLLYHAGQMSASKKQYEEILRLNPHDHHHVYRKLYALYLYFEMDEHFRYLHESRDTKDIHDDFSNMLYHYKKEELNNARNCYLRIRSSYPLIEKLLKREYRYGDDPHMDEIQHLYGPILLSLNYLPVFIQQIEKETILFE